MGDHVGGAKWDPLRILKTLLLMWTRLVVGPTF